MDNPWLARRVLNFAHRGGAFEAPSSTLFAIETALRSGATAIELDVHQSRDEVLVVSHDPTVDRTSNGSGEIAALDFEQIRELDNAFYFVPGDEAVPGLADLDYPYRGRASRDHRFGFARLEEVLTSFPGVFTNIDIKKSAPEVVPYEARLATVLRHYKRRDDVIVASFNDASSAEFSLSAPEIGTSPGIRTIRRFVLDLYLHKKPSPKLTKFVALQLPSSFGRWNLVTPHLVDTAHEIGLAVHVWTIDEEKEMERLVELGVDGVISNRPSLLCTVLRRLDAGYDAPASSTP